MALVRMVMRVPMRHRRTGTRILSPDEISTGELVALPFLMRLKILPLSQVYFFFLKNSCITVHIFR
jgi:hypothetical protein